MADAAFEERRLAEIYDPLHPARDDLSAYLALVAELGARSILDVGCGTGTFACLLAQRGMEVIGVDPATASIEVARAKPFADKVQWFIGEVTSLPPFHLDLVTMTGNVAQVFLTDEDWISALQAARSAMRIGGHLVFEVRNPDREGWQEWNRQESFERVELAHIGAVETWLDLVDVSLPFVSFRWTFVFESDGAEITSDSTLRFRPQSEILATLRQVGFAVDEVRDAPDRPGREFVFVARRTE